MSHDQNQTAGFGVERLDQHKTQDDASKNENDCPLWKSFAAARTAGVQTNDAFWDAIRLQTLRAITLMEMRHAIAFATTSLKPFIPGASLA
jgi:hypothetical protein